MEQIGGTLALSHLGKEKLNELAFALLEADPMIIDVMISTFTGTPHMGVDTPPVNPLHLLVKDRPVLELTGDQESDAYIAFISRGPITLLQTLLYGEFYPAFQVALQRSSLFPLLVRRLLRIITREVEGTKDAMTVSFHCKGVLDILCDGIVINKLTRVTGDIARNTRFFSTPISKAMGKELLDKTEGLNDANEIITTMKEIFRKI
jgi:hypothetical protein